MTSQQPLRYIHSWHYDMLANQERSRFYDNLIKENCRDKIVLEIGTGSGLLAALAIRHGAKQVICCEENPLLAVAAQQLFKRLQIEDKIKLIPKNSNLIKTEELPQVDVILHELFGSDPFFEEMIPTLSDAKRFLKPDGILLPESIQFVYQPILGYRLPEKLYYEDIELVEMGHLLCQIHPSLRDRQPSKVYDLPPVKIFDLLGEPYSYVENNEDLLGVDAVEVSFLIIHQQHKLLAAEFGKTQDRVHWSPMVFYKLDLSSDQLQFNVENKVKLVVK